MDEPWQGLAVMLRHTKAGDSVGYFAPPTELGLGAEPMPRVSIFVSVFDCHVNRAPVAGRATKIADRPGLFLNADLAKASENNERNGIVIEGGACARNHTCRDGP